MGSPSPSSSFLTEHNANSGHPQTPVALFTIGNYHRPYLAEEGTETQVKSLPGSYANEWWSRKTILHSLASESVA